MASKKKEPVKPLKGTSVMEEWEVQKSNPLMELAKSDLSLSEFKLLDAYLARIDSHRPDRKVVTFEKGEIEKILGMKQLKASDLVNRLLKLGQGVKVPDPTKRSGFRIVWVLEEVKCHQDDFGQWVVTMEASSKAMEYFFNIETIGYTSYKLRCVINIKSRYTYLLFLYLEKHRHMGLEWEIPLDELKAILGCADDKTYSEYRYFNNLVLKKCHKELNEKTECHFSYKAVRKGKKVGAVRFTLEPFVCVIASASEQEQKLDPNQYSLFPDTDECSEQSEDDLRDNICAGFSGSEFERFTLDELKVLREKAWPKRRPENEERFRQDVGAKLACEYATAACVREAILKANTRRGVKHYFQYVCTIIDNMKVEDE